MTAAAWEAVPGSRIEERVSDREFGRFQSLIHRESGIWLSAPKRALLAGRLSRRLRALGLGSFGEYLERVEADPLERTRMLDAITTNETHFFREPRHFAFLADTLLPRIRAEADRGARPRRLRVWSCACSTGEEPFSLAIALLRAFPADWDLEILATDLSTAALERARSATWPIERAAEIGPADLRAFMLRGTGPQEGLMRAGPELRALVRFARLNLNQTSYTGVGRFDLVFCRNVLMYFDPQVKEEVVGRLLGHLAPGGHLFLGHAESLSGTALPVRCVMPTVYQVGAPAGRPAGRSARP